MCEMCDSADEGPIEVTDETAPYMVSEATAAAVQIAALHANGWFQGARGLIGDMQDKWGGPATCRMSYVWAAAVFFLPRPPDVAELNEGFQQVSDRLQQITGHAPDPARVGHIVVTSDQASAAMKQLSELASKGDVEAFAATLADTGTGHVWNATMSMLLAEAGLRLRHSRDADDTRAMELFMSHVNADFTEVGSGEDEPETGTHDH